MLQKHKAQEMSPSWWGRLLDEDLFELELQMGRALQEVGTTWAEA